MKYRYREIRQENKMTLEEAAKPLGKTKQWLSKVERGITELDFKDAVALAKVYGEDTPDVFLRRKPR